MYMFIYIVHVYTAILLLSLLTLITKMKVQVTFNDSWSEQNYSVSVLTNFKGVYSVHVHVHELDDDTYLMGNSSVANIVTKLSSTGPPQSLWRPSPTPQS